MIPVVTPERMRRIDERAVASGIPLETLVERAGWGVARAAREMLGGTYGRRVVVVAGPGNNGADGRVAARFLRERGVRVTVLAADELPTVLPEADLLIDAAYGTGFRGVWQPPMASCPVLGVDVPSGVDGLTGVAHGSPWACERTVTFVAPKPGLYFHDGRRLSGRVDVVDIGLNDVVDIGLNDVVDIGLNDVVDIGLNDVVDIGLNDVVDIGLNEYVESDVGLVTADDVATWWSPRSVDAHKWNHAAFVVAGSPGMLGAASLATSAAMRTGAGIVHLATPGTASERGVSTEVVRRPIPSLGWSADVLSAVERRFRVLAIGPGLGRDGGTLEEARHVISGAPLPIVVDGDALHAVDAELVSRRPAPTVLTPHDGEFEVLTGALPAVDRIAAARDAARCFQAIVLLKGPTTVVADPSGRVALVTHGDERLATAGSGDVLTGTISGAMAAGTPPFEAAALAAWLCAEAGRRCGRHGVTASDLVGALARVLDDVRTSNGQNDRR
jgi:NAD(P)H-hydrate epimerase